MKGTYAGFRPIVLGGDADPSAQRRTFRDGAFRSAVRERVKASQSRGSVPERPEQRVLEDSLSNETSACDSRVCAIFREQQSALIKQRHAPFVIRDEREDVDK